MGLILRLPKLHNRSIGQPCSPQITPDPGKWKVLGDPATAVSLDGSVQHGTGHGRD